MSNRSRTCREDWTRSVQTAIVELTGWSVADRGSILRQYRRMGRGEDGGQLEPWGFETLRSALYPEWVDADFNTVLEHFKA